MTRSVLADAFGHHHWATLQLLDVCGSLTDDQLATAVPGTFGSILDTSRHLVGAERSYLFVCTGAALPEVEEVGMTMADLRAAMEPTGDAWAAFLATDPDPELTVTRQRDDGTRSHAPLGIRLAQVVHHGTDHRSQIATALTSIGITPPEMDVWDFGAAEGRISQD